MLKTVVIFFIMIGALSFNAQLALEKKSLLLLDNVSQDGWRHSCMYYKPFVMVTVSRPIQVPCPRYDTVS